MLFFFSSSFPAPPRVLKNVTVKPLTIMALVMWEVDEKEGNGGYAIQNFHISYRLKNGSEGDWQSCPSLHIGPDLVSCFHLLGSIPSLLYFSIA